MAIKIPFNIDEHKKAFAASVSKEDADTDTLDKPDDKTEGTRRTMSKIGKLNARIRELKSELENKNNSTADNDKLTKELQSNYEKLAEENEQLRKENDELKPYAKAAKDSEHKERHQLLANVPPEEQKDWKDAPLHLLRRYAGKATATTTEADKSKPKDWNAMKPDDLAKAISEDPKGYREFMATTK